MKPITKYDRILKKFRENDFTEKEVAEIRNFINNIVDTLPKLEKMTLAQYNALDEKDDHTFYMIYNNDHTAYVAQFLGDLPITTHTVGVFGESYLGSAIYQ